MFSHTFACVDYVAPTARRWAGRDVAVKVIEHNTDTTVPVEREVTLMLSFNHPNIVRAFHFVTRVYSSEVSCVWRSTTVPYVARQPGFRA